MTGDLTGLNNNNVFTAGFGAAGGLLAVADKVGKAIYLNGNNDSIQPIFINRQNDNISLGTIVSGVSGPREMQISPDNNSLIVGLLSSTLNYYSINSDGNLTAPVTITPGVGNMGTVAFHPDGTKLFIAGVNGKRYGARSLTSPFTVSGISVMPAALGGVPAGNICSSNAIFLYSANYSNNGQFVIFACESDKRIYSIAINQTTGDGTSIITNLDRTIPNNGLNNIDKDLTNRYFVSTRFTLSTNSLELNSISPTGALAFIQAYNTSSDPSIFRTIKFLY